MSRLLRQSKIINLAVLLFLAFGLCVAIQMTASAAITSSPKNVKQIGHYSYGSSVEISLSWDGVYNSNGEDTYYYVAYSLDHTFTSQNVVNAYDATTKVLYFLQSGKVYYVKVGASSTYQYSGAPNDVTWSDTVSMVTAPIRTVTNLKQTAATVDSITLSWKGMEEANGYVIDCYTDYKYVKTVKVNGTGSGGFTQKITGLSKDSKYYFYVYALKKGNTYEARSDAYTYTTLVPTLPTKIAASSFSVPYYWNSLKEIKLTWQEKASADGYQYEVYHASTNKKVKSGNVGYNSGYMLAKENLFYKVRVRPYVSVSGQKKYGEWSNYYYYSQQPNLTLNGTTSSGIKIKWKKVSGATNYTVYVSAKQKSGYKKVTTTKNATYTIKKCGSSKLKSGKTYYFYVVANKKVGNTTYKSGGQYYWCTTYKK